MWSCNRSAQTLREADNSDRMSCLNQHQTLPDTTHWHMAWTKLTVTARNIDLEHETRKVEIVALY